MSDSLVKDMVDLTVSMINDGQNVVGSGNMLTNMAGTAKYFPQLFSILTRVKDLKTELKGIDLEDVVSLVKETAKIDLPGDKADVFKQAIVDGAVAFLEGLEKLNSATQIIDQAPAAQA